MSMCTSLRRIMPSLTITKHISISSCILYIIQCILRMQNENEQQDTENTRVWNYLAFWCPVNFAPTPPLKMDQSGHVPPKKEKKLVFVCNWNVFYTRPHANICLKFLHLLSLINSMTQHAFVPNFVGNLFIVELE